MSKKDIEVGSSTIKAFFDFMEERHSIYLKRKNGDPKPWTDDPIFQKYRFTNVFRELDRGTVALRIMLMCETDLPLILFNVMWYRLLNLDQHATDFGFQRSYDSLEDLLFAKHDEGKQIFTSAHMTSGVAGEDKVETYLRAIEMAWDQRQQYLEEILAYPTLENAYSVIRKNYQCGPFIAYEIVTDLRWTPILRNAEDRLRWANVGPGAARGLKRLGLEDTLESMQKLYGMSGSYLALNLLPHFNAAIDSMDPAGSRSDKEIWFSGTFYPPFELREVEHSLCEFDKYERVRTGVGRPRQKFNGLPS